MHEEQKPSVRCSFTVDLAKNPGESDKEVQRRFIDAFSLWANAEETQNLEIQAICQESQ